MKPKSTYLSTTRLGILGGGQLARFLSLKAQEMGVHVRILCQSPDEPAALITQDVVLGSIDNARIRELFLSQLDVITFESEFVNAKSLNDAHSKTMISPSISIMNTLRDRLPQKEVLSRFKISTAPSIEFINSTQLLAWFESNKRPFVLKKRLFGYDGYGTIIVKSKKDLHKIPSGLSSTEWIAEEFCAFERELAFSIARNAANQFYVLPLVETKQSDSKCDWVKGPIRHKKIERLVQSFKMLLKEINYIGLLSVELFETSEGLIVNELAPRVHNSAHYSIEALQVSQFEAHLRAILSMPLPEKPRLLARGFAMANLIGGEKNQTLKFALSDEGFLHWYNKTVVKPGRKMGHLTVMDAQMDVALEKSLNWRKKFCL